MHQIATKIAKLYGLDLISTNQNTVNSLLRPALLIHLAYETLEPYEGKFKFDEKRMFNEIFSHVKSYNIKIFSKLDDDECIQVYDEQEEMYEYIKSHAQNLHFAFQKSIMFVDTERRNSICDIVVASAALLLANHITNRMLRHNVVVGQLKGIPIIEVEETKDGNIERASKLSSDLAAMMIDRHPKGRAAKGTEESIELATQVFMQKVVDWKRE